MNTSFALVLAFQIAAGQEQTIEFLLFLCYFAAFGYCRGIK